MTTLFDEASRRELPIQPNLDDVRVAAIKVGVAAIPVVGDAFAEALGLVLMPSLNRRRDDWFRDLARRLHDLETKVDGFRFEELATNEQFASATVQATQAVLRTHQEEKVEALQNAVLNVAAGSAPNEDLQSIFLNWVDRLTALHLRLLKQFSVQTAVSIQDAPAWLKADVCSQFAKELLDQGLLGPVNRVVVPNRNQLIVAEKGFYTFRAGLSPLGKQFLSFLQKPVFKSRNSHQ